MRIFTVLTVGLNVGVEHLCTVADVRFAYRFISKTLSPARRLSKAMTLRIVLSCACLIAIGCENHELEQAFFRQPLATRVERLRQYPLADPYKIFRYGNDKKEPPLMDLAIPIAERGRTAIPFLLTQLDSQADNITIRDILWIFARMASSRSYDVKSDAALMATLISRVSGMKHKGWQSMSFKELQRIKDDK